MFFLLHKGESFITIQIEAKLAGASKYFYDGWFLSPSLSLSPSYVCVRVHTYIGRYIHTWLVVLLLGLWLITWCRVCDRDYIKASKSGAGEGKIVLCFSTEGQRSSFEAARAVKAVNATGLIFVEPMTRQLPDVDVLPTVLVNLEQGTKIKNYLAGFPS